MAATQRVHASYQEIIDLSTVPNRFSCIGIHTPQGDTPRRMMPGFFTQFRRYHYDGASLTLVPAATLPNDIASVGLPAGSAPIAPADILNPILWKGCHGEDLGTILNTFYSGASNGAINDFYNREHSPGADIVSTNNAAGWQDLLETLYYRGLTDNTWAKAHPQRGFRKNGLRPLVYSMATTQYFGPTEGVTPIRPETVRGAGVSMEGFAPDTYAMGYSGTMGADSDGRWIATVPTVSGPEVTVTGGSEYIKIGNSRAAAGPSFFTPRLTGLGWLDTRNRFLNTSPQKQVATPPDDKLDWAELLGLASANAGGYWNTLPLVYMGMIMMPKSIKARQFFRLIINHRFSFAGFRGASMSNETSMILSTGPYSNFIPDNESKEGDYSDEKEIDPLAEYFDGGDYDGEPGARSD